MHRTRRVLVSWTTMLAMLVSPLSGLGQVRANGFLATFADVRVRFFSSSVDQDQLRALFSYEGGETVDLGR